MICPTFGPLDHDSVLGASRVSILTDPARGGDDLIDAQMAHPQWGVDASICEGTNLGTDKPVVRRLRWRNS